MNREPYTKPYTEDEEENLKFTQIYFNWGSFIKKIEDCTLLKVLPIYFKQFKLKAEKEGFKDWTMEGDRNMGIYSYIGEAGKDKATIQLYFDAHVKRGIKAGLNVQLSYAKEHKNSKFEKLMEEEQSQFEKEFRDFIFNKEVEITSSVFRVRLISELITKDFDEQHKIILSIWKKMRDTYTHAEKKYKSETGAEAK